VSASSWTPDPEAALAERVHTAHGSKPFGEMTREEVGERAAELRHAAGWGPTARVAGIALAWAELKRTMDQARVDRVNQLAPDQIAERAEALWIVPPGGSLLG
jgi:hypothetical protein